MSPTANATSSSVPTATGGRSFTVRASGWLALPSLFSAVNVTVTSPAACPVKVTVVPDNVAVAMSGADEATEYTSAVPENASDMSRSRVSPTANATSSSVPTATGGWSLTVRASAWLALPSLFSAVTVTVTSPAACPVNVTVVPDTAAVANLGADEVAE